MIADDIRTGNEKPLSIFLQASIDEGIDEDSERQAKELLVLTDHSVSEIAQKVGFGDASNFSTRFAKATGQSPLQYRKSALKRAEER